MERRLKQLICDLTLGRQTEPDSSMQDIGLNPLSWCCHWTARQKAKKRMRQDEELDLSLTIDRQVFETWLSDRHMQELLDNMDVGTANNARLFDVLDCDL